MDLKTILNWVVGGPGAGILIYAALEEWGTALSPKGKRYVVIFGTAILVSACYAASVYAGYNPKPADAQAWIEALAPPILTALGVSQIVHGERQLS